MCWSAPFQTLKLFYWHDSGILFGECVHLIHRPLSCQRTLCNTRLSPSSVFPLPICFNGPLYYASILLVGRVAKTLTGFLSCKSNFPSPYKDTYSSLLRCFTAFSLKPQISFSKPTLLDRTVPNARVLFFLTSQIMQWMYNNCPWRHRILQ